MLRLNSVADVMLKCFSLDGNKKIYMYSNYLFIYLLYLFVIFISKMAMTEQLNINIKMYLETNTLVFLSFFSLNTPDLFGYVDSGLYNMLGSQKTINK